MPIDISGFVANKARLLNTAEPVLHDIVLEALGIKPIKFTKIITGGTNESHRVECDNETFILRIAHNNVVDFNGEKWAMEQAALVGVPVAKMVHVGEWNINGKIVQTSIQTLVPGHSLDLVQDKEFIENYLIQSGQALSQFHSVKVDFCGRLINRLSFHSSNYRERLLKKFFENPDKISSIFQNSGVASRTQVSRIFSYLENGLDFFAHSNNVLCHADFKPEHIFVDDGRISGIIDWGSCGGIPAEFDFAWWKVFNESGSDFKLLQHGYKNKRLFENNFEQKVNMIMLHNILGLTKYYYSEGYQPALDYLEVRLSSILEEIG